MDKIDTMLLKLGGNTNIDEFIHDIGNKLDNETIEKIFQRMMLSKVEISKPMAVKIASRMRDKKRLLDLVSKYGEMLDESIVLYLRTIKNDNLKLGYFDKCLSDEGIYLIASSLDDENNKLKAVSYLDDRFLYRLASHTQDEKIRYTIALNIKDALFKLNLLKKFKNDDYKYDIIKKTEYNDADKFIYKKMIYTIDDRDKKRELLQKVMDTSSFKKYIDNSYHTRHRVFGGGKDALPSNLTFGIEIEAEKGNAEAIKNYGGKLLNGWDIKDEVSVPLGVEFSSPILHFNYRDLNEIYDVCDFAKINNLKTTEECGGHIHFGEQYLNSVDAWLWLFYLYMNMEEAFFLMANREGSLPRYGIYKNAKPMATRFEKFLKKETNFKTKSDTVERLRKYFIERSNALNISLVDFKGKHEPDLPVDTLEFRMANGQLPEYKNIDIPDDYGARDIILDVLLYGNLIMTANKLSHLPMSKNIDKLIYELDNAKGEDKVDIMLRLMFKEKSLRELFKNRYIFNKKLFKESSDFAKDDVMSIEEFKSKRQR